MENNKILVEIDSHTKTLMNEIQDGFTQNIISALQAKTDSIKHSIENLIESSLMNNDISELNALTEEINETFNRNLTKVIQRLDSITNKFESLGKLISFSESDAFSSLVSTGNKFKLLGDAILEIGALVENQKQEVISSNEQNITNAFSAVAAPLEKNANTLYDVKESIRSLKEKGNENNKNLESLLRQNFSQIKTGITETDNKVASCNDTISKKGEEMKNSLLLCCSDLSKDIKNGRDNILERFKTQEKNLDKTCQQIEKNSSALTDVLKENLGNVLEILSDDSKLKKLKNEVEGIILTFRQEVVDKTNELLKEITDSHTGLLTQGESLRNEMKDLGDLLNNQKSFMEKAFVNLNQNQENIAKSITEKLNYDFSKVLEGIKGSQLAVSEKIEETSKQILKDNQEINSNTLENLNNVATNLISKLENLHQSMADKNEILLQNISQSKKELDKVLYNTTPFWRKKKLREELENEDED